MARDWALHTITHHNTYTTTQREYHSIEEKKNLEGSIIFYTTTAMLILYFEGRRFKRNLINCFCFTKDRKEGKVIFKNVCVFYGNFL